MTKFVRRSRAVTVPTAPLSVADQLSVGEDFIDEIVDAKRSPFSGGYMEPVGTCWRVVLTVAPGVEQVPDVSAPSGLEVRVEHEVEAAKRA